MVPRLLRYLPLVPIFGLAVWFYSASPVASLTQAAEPGAGETPLQTKKITDFFESHCWHCHNSEDAKGGLDLEALAADLSDKAVMAKWVRVHDRIQRGEMPPSKRAQPEDSEKLGFLQVVAQELRRQDEQSKGTVLRRLNRIEYENTLNDLLGVRVSVAEMLPEDGKAHGFDTVGEALDLSPVQMQRYIEAAGKALDAAVSRGPKPETKVTEYQFHTGRNEGHIGKHWLKKDNGAVVFFLEGSYPSIRVQEFRVQEPGRYKVRFHLNAYQTDKPFTYGIFLGPDTFQDPATIYDYFDAQPGPISVQEVDTYLKKGDSVRLRIPGLKENRWGDVNNKVGEFTGPGLQVEKMVVEGPIVEEWPIRGHKLRFGDIEAEDVGPANQRQRPNYRPNYQIQSDDPQADIKRLLPGFVEAAFRRPIEPDEAEPFIELALAELANGVKFEQAIRTAQVAVLCSPDFLYLVEGAGRLSPHAVASRLSYLLWSSCPDQELLNVAAEGKLLTPNGLKQQFSRMLADPKAERFIKNFVGQWLDLREIEFTIPDRQLYPEFDDMLQHAMVEETERFFAEVLNKNLSLLNFIDSDWSMLNERLAEHYCVAGVEGATIRKVALKPEHRRGGILTHGSVLKVTANGTNTSPVTRGAWVLERILGIDPPPPPPGIPGVEPDIRGASTLRELLDKHRSNASCNNCHRLIDPPGFALESYDAAGGWRENYRSLNKDFPGPSKELTGGRGVAWRVGPKVDSTGETPEGQPFTDIDEYKQILLSQPDRLAYALAEKFAVYGTGRAMGFSDRAELQTIVSQVAESDYRLQDLLLALVQSRIFFEN